MKSKKSLILSIGFLLTVVGLVITLVTAAMGKLNWEKVKTMSYEEKIFPVEEAFRDIVVNDAESSIQILRSADGSCRVICPEREDSSVYHTVTVEEGVLWIQRHDQRKWYQFFDISFGVPELRVYLPEEEYESLRIHSGSGSIFVDQDFTFGSAALENTSGRIRMNAQVKSLLEAENVSGSVVIENTSPEKLTVKNTSGRIELTQVHAGSIQLRGTSGRMELRQVTAEESLSVHNVSGSVNLDRCDGGSIRIETTSGSVRGTLLTDKLFNASSSSGKVTIPRSAMGGDCDISTTSGSISIDIAK